MIQKMRQKCKKAENTPGDAPEDTLLIKNEERSESSMEEDEAERNKQLRNQIFKNLNIFQSKKIGEQDERKSVILMTTYRCSLS